VRIAAVRGALEGVGGEFESRAWSRTPMTWNQLKMGTAWPQLASPAPVGECVRIPNSHNLIIPADICSCGRGRGRGPACTEVPALAVPQLVMFRAANGQPPLCTKPIALPQPIPRACCRLETGTPTSRQVDVLQHRADGVPAVPPPLQVGHQPPLPRLRRQPAAQVRLPPRALHQVVLRVCGDDARRHQRYMPLHAPVPPWPWQHLTGSC
jgi:hypothetical protein